MRTLIIIFTILIISFQAFSGPTKLTTSYLSDEEISLNEENIKSSQFVLDLSNIQITPQINARIGLNHQKQDISFRNLVNSKGEEVALSDVDDGVRNILTTAFEYKIQNHLIALGNYQDIKSTEFSKRGTYIQNQFGFYNQATYLYLGFETNTQKYPETYFIHPSRLTSERRAHSVHNQLFNIGLSQIWNAHYISKMSLEIKDSNTYRPQQSTLRVNQNYAINQRWTYKNEIGIAGDEESQKLTEDRGYFSSRWLDQEINYEWSLDSFVGFGWSTIRELEKDPRRQLETELGTDEFGLLVKQSFEKANYSIVLAKTVNSEVQEALKLEGVLEWNF